MKFYTEYLTFKTSKHREYVNITSHVATALTKSGIQEGMILVSAMHITAFAGSMMSCNIIEFVAVGVDNSREFVEKIKSSA